LIVEAKDGTTLVGTAHVAASSVQEVEETLRRIRPARVLVELDPRRLDALRDPEAWQRTDIVQVIRNGQQHMFLVQLYLASVQAQMGRETGVPPGAELLRAVEVAGEIGAEVVLIDRDIAITLKRGFAALGFWSRLRLFWHLWSELLTPAASEPGKLDVEALLRSDALTQMTEEFARVAPPIKAALIDERDTYMASHIAEQATRGGALVAVVGAGHLAGIQRHLASSAPAAQSRADLDQLPPKRVTVGTVLAWVLPLAVVAAFVYLAIQGRWTDLASSLGWFALITGSCAALGAALALGHPWSILTAFVAAPIGTLHPLIASGWFAGLVEAKVRTPTVADFQAVKRIETLGQFWRNGVVRILLVTAVTNLGAMVGFWLASGRIAQILGGA
jgi:pheromone shutdown-related protein TraB